MFPCANCGAGLRFDPGAERLSCAYCGHEQIVPHAAEEVQELCFETYFEKAQVSEAVLEGVVGEVRCRGCGAQVQLPANISVDNCPFCDAVIDNPIQAATPAMQPGAILPFRIARAEAEARFSNWVRTRWFAPSALKKVDRLHKLQGMYAPYWTYDAMTYNFYTGMRGDDYYVTVGSGRNRRRERRTRWTSVEGQVNHWFDDVLVCSSRNLPEQLTDKLEPWDLAHCTVYRPDYISGFRAERYQIGAREGFGTARKKMDDHIQQLVRARIGGDRQRVNSVKTMVDGVTFKYVLLPMWIAAYKFNNRKYQVLVNGRSGVVMGERPWSWIKITLFVLAILATLAVLVGIFLAFG